MRKLLRKFRRRQEGYVLPTVSVFIFVITLSSGAYFSMASYETKHAMYRQASMEAFYLADGALARGMAQFKEDGTWRDGFNSISLGNGHYSLAVKDTVFDGQENIIQMLAMGQVNNINRTLEMMVEVGPSAFSYALLILGDAETQGNLCINGKVHVVGDGDFGPHDVHLQCGELTEGFPVRPPKVYTEASYYPDGTYYSVRGTQIGGDYQARILDRNGVDITTALGDSLVGYVDYDSGTKTFEYKFDKSSEIDHYFNDSSGIFARGGGDSYVVINFGEEPVMDPPGSDGIANVILKGNSSTNVIHATLINSRFIGSQDTQRLDTIYWMGGGLETQKVAFEPYGGLSAITHNFLPQNGTLTEMGTASWPALLYVTGDIPQMGANFESTGEILCLGDFFSQGGPDINYDPDFQDNLPAYFFDPSINGVMGQVKPLRWREITFSI